MMLRLMVAFMAFGSQAGAEVLDPPLGHLFVQCDTGLIAVHRFLDGASEMDPLMYDVGSSVRYYLIGLAHGTYGAADPDGYAKLFTYFVEKCREDKTLRIEAIGRGM